jgi:hypothetical protein
MTKVTSSSLSLTDITYTGNITSSATNSTINIGSGQFYKSNTGNVAIGKTNPAYLLDVNGTISANGSVIASNFIGSGSGLTSIPNSAIGNNSITINGTTIPLGNSATISTTATITDDTVTNSSRYVIFGPSTSGSLSSAYTSSTKLNFNPSSGTLTATTFSGAFSGSGVNITGTAPGLTANITSYVAVTPATTGTYYPKLSSGLTGVSGSFANNLISFVADTGTLTSNNITVPGVANVSGILSATSYREKQTALTISSGAITINCSLSNVFTLALSASVTSISFSNIPATTNAFAFVLSVTQGAGAYAITWPASVKWPSATAPTLTSTNAKIDTFVLITWDGGTNWYAFTVGQNT